MKPKQKREYRYLGLSTILKEFKKLDEEAFLFPTLMSRLFFNVSDKKLQKIRTFIGKVEGGTKEQAINLIVNACCLYRVKIIWNQAYYLDELQFFCMDKESLCLRVLDVLDPKLMKNDRSYTCFCKLVRGDRDSLAMVEMSMYSKNNYTNKHIYH